MTRDQARPALAPLLLGISLLAAATIGCAGEAPDLRADGPSGGGADRGVALVDGSGGGRADAGSAGDSGGSDDSATPRRDSAPRADSGGGGLVPPRGGSSRGSGGDTSPVSTRSVGGVTYSVVVPASYAAGTPNKLMIVFSGTEGRAVMTQNVRSVAAQPQVGLGDVLFAVLDGPATFGNGAAGATVLDDVRKRYNIDNDRTYLLSESAGTRAGLALGLSLRQSYFAAYWANDVNSSAKPAKSAAQLGFAPWGNVGPGGALSQAQAIVAGMKAAGYRLPADAPYSGAGSTQHGSPHQFLAALAFFRGKTR